MVIKGMLGVALALATVTGQTATSAGTVEGVWSVTLMSHQLGLELQQDGTALTGTLNIRGNLVEVVGTFKDGALELRGVGAKLRGPDGGEPVELRLTGRLEADGTLAGQATSPKGPERWTAERLKRQ